MLAVGLNPWTTSCWIALAAVVNSLTQLVTAADGHVTVLAVGRLGRVFKRLGLVGFMVS